MAISGGGISVTVTLDDQFSGPLSRANSAADSFTQNINRMIRGVEAARGTIAVFRGDIEAATTAFAAFGVTAAASGGIAAIFVNAAQQAAEYQRQILLVQNNTTLTDAATKQLSASIIQMSTQTGSTLSDLAQGYMHISNFGNDAAMATAQLAEANKAAIETGAQVSDVANAGAAIMHEYNAQINQTSAYYNTLAEAAKLGNTTMQQFVEGSSRSIAVAANLGVSFQDVAAAMDAMTRHGFDMSASNTQIASLMKNIIDPTPAARKEIEALSKATGVDLAYDFSIAGLQAKGLMGVMNDLAAATAKNRDEIFKIIPATRGGQAALVLSGVGNADEQQSLTQLQDTMQGKFTPIEDGFARMQQTASQQMAILKANVQKDAVEIGQGLLSMVTPLSGAIAHINPEVVSGGVQALGITALGKFAMGGAGVLAGMSSAGIPKEQQDFAKDLLKQRQQIYGQMSDTFVQTSKSIDDIDKQTTDDIKAHWDATYERYREMIDAELAGIKQTEEAFIASEERKAEIASINFEKQMQTRNVSQDFEHQSLDLQFAQQDARAAMGSLSTEQERQVLHDELSQRQELSNQEFDQTYLIEQEANEKLKAVREKMNTEKIESIRVNGQAERDALLQDSTQTAQAIGDAAAKKLDATLATNDANMFFSNQALKRTETAAAANNIKFTGPQTSVIEAEAEGGFTAAVGQKLGAIGEIGQELIIPITIALIIKDVLLDPGVGKIQDMIAQWVSGKQLNPEIKNTSDMLDEMSGRPFSEQANSINDNIKNYQDIIDRAQQAKKASENQFSNAGPLTMLPGIGLLFGGAARLGAFNGGVDKDYDAMIATAQQQIQGLNQEYSFDQGVSLQGHGIPQPFSGMIDKGVGIVSNDLLDKVAGGSKTADEATASFDKLAETYKRFIPDVDSLTKSFKDNLAQIVQQKDAADALAAQQHEDAQKYLAMGAPVDMVMAVVTGKNANGTDASKEQVAQAKRDLQDIAKGWQDAASAIGGVNMKNGLQGLADAADKLAKAQDELQKFGINNSQLTDLNGVADQFKALSDLEKNATSDMEGYNLELQRTIGFINQINQLKTGFNNAVGDAQARALAGVASDSDMQLIANRGTIMQSLNNQSNALGSSQSAEWLNIGAVIPDWEKIDQIGKDLINEMGGGKVLMARVDADVQQAQAAIDAIINKPYTINVSAQMASVFGTFAPGSWGASIFGGGSGTSGSYAGSSPVPSGNLNTAHGSANALDPYRNIIEQYAKQSGIPDWLIGAIIMHESSGVQGAQNPSGASGLMQVMPGSTDSSGHPYDVDLLRQTTGQAAAQYQIAAGVGVLQQKLADPKAQGSITKALQMYGGYSDTSSSAYFDDLFKNYGPGVAQELSGSGGNMDDQGITASAADSVRNRLVQQALSQVGTDKLVGYCEQWVEDTVQAVLGNRGPAGGAASATSAFNLFQSEGMVRPQNQQPQPGDLVYYPDPNGGSGHVAIYVGGGQQASTWDHGAQTGTNRLIHVEPVGQGARYVALPGTGMMSDTGGPSSSNFINGDAGTPPPINAYQRPVNLPDWLKPKSASEYVNTLGSDQASADAITRKLQPDQQINLQSSLEKNLPILQQIYSYTSGIPEQFQSATDKAVILATSQEKGLEIEQAQAQYMYDIENHTGNVKDDITAINAAAGPLASNILDQANAWLNVQTATDKVKADQQTMSDIEAQHTQQTQQRQVEDESLSRGKQVQEWNQQLSDHSIQLMQQSTRDTWQDQQNILDQQKTQEQRNYEDATNNLERQHTLQQRNDDDQLKALERLQVTQQSSDSETERVLKSQAAGPGTLQQKFQAGEQLSIQVDYDQRQKQSMVDQISNLKDEQTQEQRNYEDQKYYLDQQHTQSQRNFEDESTQSNLLHQQIERQWQADADAEWTLNFNRQKDDTEAQWQLQDKRNREDQLYNLEKQSIDLKTKNDQQDLDNAKQMSQLIDSDTQSMSKLVSITQGFANIINGVNIGSAGTVPGFAGGGQIHSPLALVGENGPEIISAMGYYVSPVRGLSRGSGSGGSVNLNVNVYGKTEGFTDSELAEIQSVAQNILDRKARANPIGKARGRY